MRASGGICLGSKSAPNMIVAALQIEAKKVQRVVGRDMEQYYLKLQFRCWGGHCVAMAQPDRGVYVGPLE